MKITKVCKECGSEQVMLDAWAAWDVDKQEWTLYDVFPDSWCETCEGVCTIIDKEIEI